MTTQNDTSPASLAPSFITKSILLEDAPATPVLSVPPRCANADTLRILWYAGGIEERAWLLDALTWHMQSDCWRCTRAREWARRNIEK